MRDPLEGLSAAGTIVTGADVSRVPLAFRPVHAAAVAMISASEPSASIYAYGSTVTGQARIGTSDVDLMTIGLQSSDARRISGDLSKRFAKTCRGVEIGAASAQNFVGEDDVAYGNRVFLRHYCVLLAGSDVSRPQHDFPGDRRAARGFNGDIAEHARRWRHALETGSEPAESIARRMARKSLLSVAGLVSAHDGIWTTDRETGAARWAEIDPEHRAGLAQLLSWTQNVPDASTEPVQRVLDGTVDEIVSSFRERIGLWPNRS